MTTVSADVAWTLAITKLGKSCKEKYLPAANFEVTEHVALAKIESIIKPIENHEPRERVANILRELNPAGTRERRPGRLTRRRYSSCGPNFCWHVVLNSIYRPR